jgi:hypothetical protein
MRRNRSNLVLAGWPRLPAVLAVAGGLLWPGAAPASGKKKKPAEPFALISGTVFRDTGMSLAGAEVTAQPRGSPRQAQAGKKITVTTDARGEFAIRVPAAPLGYTVSVRAGGYKRQEKAVSVAGEERVDVFIRLEPQ